MIPLAELQPAWIIAIAVAASLLINLALLGAVLGRRDRQLDSMVKGVRKESRQGIAELRRRIEDCEGANLARLEELRRAVSRLELRDLNGPPRPKPAPAVRRAGIDKKHHVFRLASRGMDSDRIARRLNMYRGETELVLGLQQFMASRGKGPAAPAGWVN